VPLEWKELKGLKAASQFSIDDVIRRIKKKSPNPERYQVKQRIPGK
jgi:DNA primase